MQDKLEAYLARNMDGYCEDERNRVSFIIMDALESDTLNDGADLANLLDEFESENLQFYGLMSDDFIYGLIEIIFS